MSDPSVSIPQENERSQAARAAELAARASYGRLLSFLASRTRDIAIAEDALSDAFAQALITWPKSGAPTSPEAWLLTTARRRLIDMARRDATAVEAVPTLQFALDEAMAETQRQSETDQFTDERLKLLFICAHPAIDASVRTPLMLHTTLGLDANRIAKAFLTTPATMSQRLVRAKRKIAKAGIPFETPDDEALPERFPPVLDAIYATFNAGSFGGDGDLAKEGLFLARLCASLAPTIAEAHGLHALTAYIEARRSAHVANGAYTPLDHQDTALWDQDLLEEAESALTRAASLYAPGRFQLEAAIQSANIAHRLSGEDTGQATLALYDRLIDIAPSIGAKIARAGALLRAGDVATSLASLRGLPAEKVRDHQPYWACLAHVLAASGDAPGADGAFDRAIKLCTDDATRKYLILRQTTLRTSSAS